MKFDLETFNKFDFIGSQITNHNVHGRQSEKTLLEFNLEGSFAKKQYESCKFWSLWFKKFENPSDVNISNLTGNKMNFLDICPEGEFFLVKMIVETNGDVKEIAFRCRNVF